MWSDNFLPMFPSSFTVMTWEGGNVTFSSQKFIQCLHQPTAEAPSDSYPVVSVVFKHADTMFNDEEEVDASERR